jgi:hypothetical protein
MAAMKNMTVVVRVRRLREMKVRFRVSLWLLKLACRVGTFKAVFEIPQIEIPQTPQ